MLYPGILLRVATGRCTANAPVAGYSFRGLPGLATNSGEVLDVGNIASFIPAELSFSFTEKLCGFAFGRF